MQIDKNDKEQVTKILQKLGVSLSELINMTIKQTIMRGSISFEESLPKEGYDLYKYFSKEELEETAKELAYMGNHLDEYPSYDNIKDLKKSLLR